MRFECLAKTTTAHTYIYERRAQLVVIWFLKNALDRKQGRAIMYQYSKRVISLQRNWRKHLDLQTDRKTIMEHFWALELDSMADKLLKKHTKEQENLYEKIKAIPEDVREAVIQKWLSYAKSENITEFMMWRTYLMANSYTLEQ